MVKTLVAALVVAGSMGIAACNTVRGAAADMNSAANCTESAMKTGQC